MKKLRSLVALTAAAALLLAGCSSDSVKPTETTTTQSNETERVITDHAGIEVTLPAKVERVVFTKLPIASTYMAYFNGEAPYLVGMPRDTAASLKGTLAEAIAPKVVDVETSFYDAELNMESLLKLDPDVVFYNSGGVKQREMFNQAGIPAVGFNTDGDPAELYVEWLKLLEQVFNEPGKTDDIVKYSQAVLNGTVDKVAKVADSDRKSALVFWNFYSDTLLVAGEKDNFGAEWLENINVVNAAVGAEGVNPVTTEQILAWEPDVLLVSGSGRSDISIDQFRTNTVDGVDLSTLNAVKDGNVFTSRLGMWSWFTPNTDAPLIATWLAAAVYPELFEVDDVYQLTKEYYQKMYNYKLSDEEIAAVYENAFPE